MKDIQFHTGTIPNGFQFNFSRSIFNLPEHLRLQAYEGWHTFYALDNGSEKIEAVLFLHVENYRASSPRKAPFGSIEFSDSISPTSLFQFIDFFERKVKKLGVTEIKIKNPPHAYHAGNLSLLQVLLLNAGYRVALAEPGACITVSEKNFDTIIRASEKQVLTQGKKGGLICKPISLAEFKNVYAFIRIHLSEKGYSISMIYDDLQDTVDVFSENFFLYGVYEQQKLIAASVSIQVTDYALYNFYIAHDAAYNTLSPAVMIVEALYQHCQKSKLRVLDLGTSSTFGKPNFSLLDFKLRLGAEVSEKLTFVKSLM